MSAPFRVAIMGAGAIGCYVGGRLASGGADVVLVGRPSIADEIAAHGLRLTRYDGVDATVSAGALRVATTPAGLAALTDRDVVIVTVKSGDTATAAAQLRPIIDDPCTTTVVSLQNGVNNAQVLAAGLPKLAGAGRVVPAMVPFNVLRAGAGRFHQGTSGRIALPRPAAHAAHAAHEQVGATIGALVLACRAGKLGVHEVRDIRAIQWGKLLVNLNNAVNALAGVPIHTMIRDRGYRRVMAAVLDEAVHVLRAAHVRTILEPPVPAQLVARILRMSDALFSFIAPRLIKVDAEARSSMWDDLQRRRLTEIDALNGEIVALAAKNGGRAPVNEVVVRLVKEAEAANAGSPGLSSTELQRHVLAERIGG